MINDVDLMLEEHGYDPEGWRMMLRQRYEDYKKRGQTLFYTFNGAECNDIVSKIDMEEPTRP